MRSLILLQLLITALPAFAQQTQYYPPPGSWQQRPAVELGFDTTKLRLAVEFALTVVDSTRTDSASIANARPNEAPYNTVIGPWLTPRGGVSGMVIRHGYVVAQWGDTKKVDMTFSATKSYLSTVAGIAFDAGMIRSVTDTVARVLNIPEFAPDPHNARITWHQLLNQTSEWQGTLWEKPDWADRFNPRTGKRPVKEPGSAWTYNDVRVNVLALALLHLWQRPLPDVLREKIMDPIGASSTWRWHGYRNSYVTINNARVQSVSGGGHWGGGLHIDTEDHARFGLLFLRNGKWRDKQLLSEKWIAQATAATDVKPDYGYLWWLNTTGTISGAPRSAFWAAGAGGNYVYVDRENDLVVVLRWTRQFGEVIDRILRAMTP